MNEPLFLVEMEPPQKADNVPLIMGGRQLGAVISI